MLSKLVLLLILYGFVFNILHAQESEPDARALVTAAIAAKGGKDRLLQFPAWRIKYRETFLRDGKKIVESGEAYEHLARGHARYETGPDHLIVVDGKKGWIRNGNKVTALTAAQIADFQEYLKGKEAMLTVLPLLTDEWQLSVVGEKNLDGRMAVALRITGKGWTATTYWDKKTHLLLRAQYPHKRLIEPDDAKRKATLREAEFTDYRAMKGILFHTKLLAYSHGKQLGEVEFTEIQPMKRLPDNIISEPK
jgi:hypothetical protein